MKSNIRILMSKKSDQIVTQAIERYWKMEEKEAIAAILAEWPQQMAVVLALFMAVTACPATKDIYRFAYRARKNNDGNYISLFTDHTGRP